MSEAQIIIANDGTQLPLKKGFTLFNNLVFNNIQTYAQCGGKAMCGRCRVKITDGSKYCSAPVQEEILLLGKDNIAQGWRLACQTYCLRTIHLVIPTLQEIEQQSQP
jgi:ferredoxin